MKRISTYISLIACVLFSTVSMAENKDTLSNRLDLSERTTEYPFSYATPDKDTLYLQIDSKMANLIFGVWLEHGPIGNEYPVFIFVSREKILELHGEKNIESKKLGYLKND